MSFFPSMLLYKKDLTLINSLINPTLPNVGEADMLMDIDGVTCHMWDRQVGGTTLRYRTANNLLLDNWSGTTTCTGLPLGIFPLIFEYNNTIYLLWKHNSDLKYYIYTTTNKVHFTLAHALPLISASTVSTDWNKNIYNLGGCVVGNKLHLMLEGNADTEFYYFPSHLGYCCLNLDTFQMEVQPPVAIPTVYNSLCPVLVYSKINHSIISVYSYFDLITSTPPTQYMGGTRAMTADMSLDLTKTSSWDLSKIKFPELNEDQNINGKWAADFAIVFTPNKTYPMLMFYNFLQATGYQAYANIKNEQELYNSIKFAGNKGLNLSTLNGKKIVIEGDSIVNGVLVTGSQRWSTLLTQAIGAIEVNQGVNSKVLHNGSTCGQPLFSNANIPIKDSTYGLFILALGVNDILYDNGTFTPENYKTAMISAIQNMKSKGWVNENILVLSPYFLRSGANNGAACGSGTPSLARYNSYVLASRQACEIERCMYCDISTVYSDLDMADLIHPNANGHSKLSSFLLNKNHITL